MGIDARSLPERDIRGYDLLKTLVTCGSSHFKFDRLFKILDELCDEKILDGNEIVAQTGDVDYKIRNFKNFDFKSAEELNALQDEADLIICHAGTGTVVGSLKKGKKVIVFPRLKEYNEHESDNQLELAVEFERDGYVLCAKNKEELKDRILKINEFSPVKFISNKENFVALIRNLLNA